MTPALLSAAVDNVANLVPRDGAPASPRIGLDIKDSLKVSASSPRLTAPLQAGNEQTYFEAKTDLRKDAGLLLCAT